MSFPDRLFPSLQRNFFLDKDQSQFRKKHPRTSDSECYPIFRERNMYLKKNKIKTVTSLFSGNRVSLTLAFVPCFTNPICAL